MYRVLLCILVTWQTEKGRVTVAPVHNRHLTNGAKGVFWNIFSFIASTDLNDQTP